MIKLASLCNTATILRRVMNVVDQQEHVTFFADRLVMWHHNMKAKQADLIMLINQAAQKYSELFVEVSAHSLLLFLPVTITSLVPSHE